MPRFHIHRTFEEELAKKADEFSMQPRSTTWQGIEQGVVKTQSIKNLWKAGLLGMTVVVVLSVLYIQSKDSQQKEQAVKPTLEINPHLKAPSAHIAPPSKDKTQTSGVETEIVRPFSQRLEATKTQASTLNPVFNNGEETPLSSSEFSSAQHQALLAIETIAMPVEYHPEANAAPVFKRKPIGIRRKDGWYLQASYTPNYSYRNIAARTNYALPLENSKKENDQAVAGFSVNLSSRYHFSERFSLAFGLAYTEHGEKVGMAPRKDNQVYNALANEYGYDKAEMNSLGSASHFTNRYSYIEIPVTAYTKKMLSPRLSLSTGLGLSVGYMTSMEARCYDYRVDHYVNNPKFLRHWNISSHAKVLVDYHLNTRWAMAAGPEVSYALLSTYKNYYTLSQHQFSVGMNMGIQWKIFDITKSPEYN